jgi:iron-sulfur cluster assembly protein
MIKLTNKASEELKKIVASKEAEPIGTIYLRIGCHGGGCSGYAYDFDVIGQEDISEKDSVFEQEGIKIACDPKSLIFLDGTIVDFKDELMERGFIFSNPNATGCCGCNKSFSC